MLAINIQTISTSYKTCKGSKGIYRVSGLEFKSPNFENKVLNVCIPLVHIACGNLFFLTFFILLMHTKTCPQ